MALGPGARAAGHKMLAPGRAEGPWVKGAFVLQATRVVYMVLSSVRQRPGIGWLIEVKVVPSPGLQARGVLTSAAVAGRVPSCC